MIVSFAIVAYNEEKALPHLLKSLSNQDYPHEKIEVLLIDSMSQDSTRDIMNDFAVNQSDFKRVVVLSNEKKSIPCGCNVALENYTGDAMVRIDAHASIPTDFISKSVEILNEDEKIAGGQVISVAASDSPIQDTMLIVENSVFCGGVAKFRHLKKREYVDTMAFALYRREVYDKVGKYNELLPRSEDNDMNYRIRKAGFKMCCDPTITSTRYNRGDLKSLIRQKYLNGYWIGKTMGINPHCFSLFHFVPFAFVLGIVATTILALVGFPYLSWLMWALYGVLIIGISCLEIFSRKFSATNLLLPFLFFALHISYGVGTLIGLIEMPFWIKKVMK